MPLAMDYVIDSNEQDEYEVKYKGEVIGKERYHELAVSMITGHIAGRCERAEARVAELDKIHDRIMELELSVENGTAIMRENTVLLARVSELESKSHKAYENGWRAAIEAAAVKLENYSVAMLKVNEAALAAVIDRDIDIAAELREMKLLTGADHKCSECGFAHAPGGNTCCSR